MSSQEKSCLLTSLHIRQSKGQKKIVMLTAYDYPSALLADQAGVDILLVGDSLGMVVLGQPDTLTVTMDMMVHHCRAVALAQKRPGAKALVVCDMPFLSYEESPQSALRNAGRLMAEGGARAVKLEGCFEIIPQIRALIAAGIPVMGHIGLTPQRVSTLGGYKVQGRSAEAATLLLQQAQALEEAGCFSLVLECVPQEVAALITQKISIPTIGIGAGKECDGQVLVFHDMLGINTGHTPKFVQKYANLADTMRHAIEAYVQDVQQGNFPQAEHTFSLEEEEKKALQEKVKG